MRALVWEAPRVMAVREQEAPTPGPDEVLIRVAYAGICGSELFGYLGLNALRVPPLVMGHEFAGEIAALGANATRMNPGLAVGQQVTVNPFTHCGECALCTNGLPQLCPKRKLLGAHIAGGYAEYVSVRADQVTPLPQGVPLQTGALTEPAAVAVRSAELAGRLDGQPALVVGAGPIGLLVMQALCAQGASRVYVSDLDPDRLAMVKPLGGEPLHAKEVDVPQAMRDITDGWGLPVTVDAVGTGATRAVCIAATRSTGKVVLTGLHEESSPAPFGDVIRREIVLQGAYAYTPENFADALGRLTRREMRLDPWIVEADLAEGWDWYEKLLSQPGPVAKVLLKP